MIVVVDCNIWITLAINRQIDFIADLSDNGITIAGCPELRTEIISVLSRPKLSKFISTLQTNKVVELYDLVTTSYKLGKIPHIVLDLKDNYLFALADKSKADYLVTGDKLLLEVKEYKKTKTITLADFREITR